MSDYPPDESFGPTDPWDAVIAQLSNEGRAEMAMHVEQMLAHIESLEAQLAARNQAAEAMGVLERLVEQKTVFLFVDSINKDFAIEKSYYDNYSGKVTQRLIGRHPSLIEAVLKAGGEG